MFSAIVKWFREGMRAADEEAAAEFYAALKPLAWEEHPKTLRLRMRAAEALANAKRLKQQRDRVGRSADYWQGQIDALLELGSGRILGMWNRGYVRAHLAEKTALHCWTVCPVCGARNEEDCDAGLHG